MSRSRLAIAAWLALLVFCAWHVSQARIVADLSSFLPSHPTPEQRLLVDQLRDGAVSRMVLLGIEGGDAATRARLSQALAAALRADAQFASVANGASMGFERERELLLRHRYVLSPHVTPERFTVAGLRGAISETIELLASPAGMMLKSVVPRDPTGEMLAVAEQLRPPEGPAVRDGVWTSPDGARALVIARTRAAGSDTDAQARALAAIEDAFRAVAPAGEARLLASGPGIFSVKARAMVQADVKRLTALGAIIIVSLLLLVYRSPVALGLGLVPVLTGVLAGITAVTLGFDAIHGITLGFGSALLGEAIDYSIYLFVQAGEAGERGEQTWAQRFWPTVRLGVLTSIAGFSALLFSGLPGLVQLGLYASVGLVVAAAVTRFVLPALLPAGFRIRDVTPIGERLAIAARLAPRARWAVVVLALGAAVFLGANHATLWNRELSSLNPIAADDRRIDAELRAALGASDARHVVAVKGATADAALEAAERVGRQLDPLLLAGQLGGYESAARVWPSAATQRARTQSLPEPEVLRARLTEALEGLPLRAERLEPFIADVTAARGASPLTREALAGSALEAALDGLLFRDSGGQWTALLGLRPPSGTSRADIDAVSRAVAASGVDGALLVDVKTEIDRMYAGYFNRALAVSALGLLAIVAMLFFALRDARRVLRVMAPLLAGVLVVAAWHVASGTALTLLHLVGLLLVVAIGSNYALFFDRMAASPDASHARTLASLLLANVTTVAGFGVLAFSSVPVLQSIGSTVALGAFLTLIFAAALAAPLVRPKP